MTRSGRTTLVAVLAAVLPLTVVAQTAWPPPAAPPGPPAAAPPVSPQPAAPAPAGGARTPGRIELTAIAGYQVNTDIDTVEGSVRVDDAPVYGAVIGVAVRPTSKAELIWLYSEPTVRASSPRLLGPTSFGVASHFFQLGGTHGIRRQAFELFGGGTIGAAVYLPGTLRLADGSTVSLDDTWRFAFTLGAGVKVHATPKVALRFETRVAAPVYFDSGGIYVGSGGAGLGVSGGVPLWQWNFLAGLAFAP
jgi:opacity protein-like surface antigen